MKFSFIVACFCLLLSGCDSSLVKQIPEGAFELQGLEGEKIMYVDEYTTSCVGVAVQQCLLVKESKEDAWELWYDGIKGFDHKAGTSYVLRIVEKQISNPPQDASSIAWELIEVLEEF